MASRPKAHRLGLLIAGGAAILGLLRLFAPDAESAEPAAVEPVAADAAPTASASARKPAAARADLQLAKLDAARGRPDVDDPAPAPRLFAPHPWQPPPPPPARKLPPAPPEPERAPPFPYAYFGGLTDGAVRTAFFLKGNRVIALHSGDVVDAFRVDSLDAKQATLTYLPLSQTVTVTFGSTP